MNPELRKRAFALYKPPFRFDALGGYIWDANNEMIADQKDVEKLNAAVCEVRGWGRMKYLVSPEELQDTVGELIAEALTDLWKKEHSSHKGP